MNQPKEIGMKDSVGIDIFEGDYVKFDFSDLMDTPFSNSHFGQLINKHKLEKCVIHFMAARTFQPDYGWHHTLCYVIYFVKNGDLFLSREDIDADSPPYIRKGDEPPYFTYDMDARFLVYINKKDKFTVAGHSDNKTLTLDEVLAA